VPANRVDPSNWEGGGVYSQHSFEEGCSMMEDIPTGAVVRNRRISKQAKLEKRKETK
jgi:hypothetical protein